MIIKLEDINNRGGKPIFVGSRRRLASATGVVFLDSNLIVVTSLVGHRMYLIQIDVSLKTHEIINCIPTCYKGKEIRTDLIDYDGAGSIITSNCELNSVSLYRATKTSLEHSKDIPIREESAHFCHGARFLPNHPDIICACCSNSREIYFISSETTEILYQFGHGDWKPKDVCFLGNDKMIVVYVRGNPTKVAVKPYEAKLSLVEFDLKGRTNKIITEIQFQNTHMDNCQAHGGNVYVNDQMNDRVLVCKLTGNQLIFDHDIHGFSFPHGLSLLPASNMLAVTNYGTNCLDIRELD